MENYVEFVDKLEKASWEALARHGLDIKNLTEKQLTEYKKRRAEEIKLWSPIINEHDREVRQRAITEVTDVVMQYMADLWDGWNEDELRQKIKEVL